MADANGVAEIELPMPENLTSWKIHAWSLAHGTVVGSGTAEVITAKDLLIRLQAPRFFVQKDEVTLSANVHNYLDGERDVRVRLETDGGVLALVDGEQANHSATIPAGQDRRVDWRVRVTDPGEAVVRMIATTGEASDAMEMTFPSFVHGMLKTDSYSAAIRRTATTAKMTVTVPEERRPEQTHLEVRYSPSIALAMVDALPYLAGYEYKHSEAALSRFVPLAVTRKLLVDMGVDLEAVKEKRTNLNPQEIGDPKKRAAQWKKGRTNPVFDNEQVNRLIARGLRDLSSLQNGDGGWGWCPQSKSGPHSTAYVVHGLQMAKAADVAVPQGMIDRGVAWLENYQKGEVAEDHQLAASGPRTTRNRTKAAGRQPRRLRLHDPRRCRQVERRDARVSLPRPHQAVDLRHGHARAGVRQARQDRQARHVPAEHRAVPGDRRREPDGLPEPGRPPDVAGLLVVLVRQRDRGPRLLPEAALPRRAEGPDRLGLVKYLLNNRKHATYWYCTRDTALSVEALADFVKASGEAKPDMTVEVLVDGKKHKEIRITPDNLFTFDNVLHLRGDALDTGEHTIEVRRKGDGPALLQRLPDQLHPGGLHHQGRAGDQGRAPLLQAGARRSGHQGRRLARPGARLPGREVRAGAAEDRRPAHQRRPGRGRVDPAQQERLRIPAVRGLEAGRFRSGDVAQRLGPRRRVHGAARREGRLPHASPAAGHARSPTACEPRSPARSAPCPPRATACTPPNCGRTPTRSKSRW